MPLVLRIVVKFYDSTVCVYAFTFLWLRGWIRARTWCCELVGGCEVRFPTSSQLGPRK